MHASFAVGDCTSVGSSGFQGIGGLHLGEEEPSLLLDRDRPRRCGFGVRVRGGEVVSVTSRLTSAVGPRGGVAISSDGLEVRIASAVGARASTGVLVPSRGMFEASVTGALVPGPVVEAWINSQPRLVAAALVPEDGGTVAFAIPTGAPLDGGEPIEDGAHTLELRMYTEDGFEIVATGITVGPVVPTRIPAGEGPMPFGAVLFALLAAAGALLAGRRLVTAG